MPLRVSRLKDAKKKPPKWSPDLQALNADFFCHLTYMAAVSTSGISRGGLFNYSERIPLMSASYFQKINVVARAFNHDYAESCRIVGEATKEPDVKALLLRLSGALASGEEIAGFLEKEAEVASEKYGDHYEGGLESLKKWTDAYVALIMTCAIVVVMAVVTLIIGSSGPSFILSFGSMTVMVTLVGVWMIYKSAPREKKAHALTTRSREHNFARFFFIFLLPFGVLVMIVMLVLGASLGAAMLTGSVLILPLGIAALLDDIKIARYENDIGAFLRALGGTAQATSITINEALSKLDSRSLVSLKEGVSLLYTRIQAGIEGKLCWERLVAETGSELVVRAVRIFLDSISIGGEAERVGREAGLFALKISLLRTKRRTVASGFSWLVMVMHGIMVALVLFIFHTMLQFSILVQDIIPEDIGVAGIPTFGIYNADSSQMGILHFMTIGIVLVLTVANAFAIYAADGSHYYKLFYYLAITMGISGAALVMVPQIVQGMLNSMT
jgi:archaeal flagellar protein FlaJ